MALKLLNNEELNSLLAELLNDENRDKTLGELDEDLSSKLSELKKLIDMEIIDYRDLRKEIAKYIDMDEQSVPGSVSQLLKGCLSSSGSCPINRDVNVSYTYDVDSDRLIQLNNDVDINNNSSAVIYMVGEPDDITKRTLFNLREKGFNKLKIKFKDLTMANYDTFVINDLDDHLDENDNMTSIFIISVIVLIFGYILYRKS